MNVDLPRTMAGPASLTTPRAGAATASAQLAALAGAIAWIAARHWANDGLWFQGDAPRHAANGFFWWDLAASLPAHPLAFALEYYARYPVIAPVSYPPLFYLLEGAAYHLAGPSAYAAKALVIAATALLGVYTSCWGRRWIGPWAGWAGVLVVLMPGAVRYGNAVLLNVPATACAFAALYHARRASEEGRPHAAAAAIWAGAAVLTYYPALLGLAAGVVLVRPRRLAAVPAGARAAFLAAAAAIVLVPIGFALTGVPLYVERHLPMVRHLWSARAWGDHLAAIRDLVGPAWLAIGAIGLAAGCASRPTRHEAGVTAGLILTMVVIYVTWPAADPRYVLPVMPYWVLAGLLGVAACRQVPGSGTAGAGAALVALVWVAAAEARTTAVPRVDGFERIARELRDRAPQDAVLYDGWYDGTFGFYVRALDPAFERRVVLASKLLYEQRQHADFTWTELPHASSPEEIVREIRTRCGCRYVALEMGPESRQTAVQRLLRATAGGPDFERVGSYPVRAFDVVRVDLFRLRGAVAGPQPLDLRFPSFSDRVFRGVLPIPSRGGATAR